MTTTSASVLVSAVGAAAATAAAIVWLAAPASHAQEGPVPEGALAQRIAGLEQQLDEALRSLRELRAAQPAPATRSAAPALPDAAELETLVAGLVAKHLAARGDADAPPPGALTRDQALARLGALGGNFDAIEKLWQDIEAAGLEQEVLAHFEALAKASPDDPHAQYLYGAYLIAGIEDEPMSRQGTMAMAADAAFDRTLGLDENHWGARFLKATSLSFWPRITGKHLEALKHFEILADKQEHQSQQPHFVQTYLFLGNMLAEQGDREKARAAYERGRRWFPDDEELKAKLDTLGK